tara:strand:+ start:633 stop:788 length:156 start_codon:yes stop_codon:yes gene_type:complete
MNNAIFAFIAYALLWAMLIAYIVILAKRQSEMRGQLDEIEHALTTQDTKQE